MLTQDEIDSLLSSLNSPAGAATGAPGASNRVGNAQAGTGKDDDVNNINYKLYNFRRPDKFSKEHLRALQSVHENFSRQLTLQLTTFMRMPVDVDVVSVDQLTYDEFVRSMPSPMTVCILELNPLPGQVLLGLGHEVTSSMINRLLGGPGCAETKARELTDIEQSLLKRVIDKTCLCLEESWRSMYSINANQVGMEESYALIQVASSSEIVALMTFEVTVGGRDSGLMSLCIPYPVLECIIEQLNSQQIYHQKTELADDESRAKVLGKIRHATLPVRVFLGGTQISFSEILKLRVNDVVILEQQIKDDLLVCVNEQPKFYAKPGTLNEQLAVAVSKPVDDIELTERFRWQSNKSGPKSYVKSV
ncbi:MAG: flagellar motor switch protein FliM [Vampirovibrionales bacterium]|nr:flagellar motor switch protein FliM [Vampirovibrionales bacterium]